jgi:hypothetical protein
MRAPRRLQGRVPAVAALIAAAVVVAGLSAPYAAAAPSRSATAAEAPRPLKEPRRHRPTGRLQVRFKDGVNAAAQQAAFDRAARHGHTIRVDRRVRGLNAVLIGVDSAVAVQRLLRNDPSVKYVEPESRYEAFADEAPSNELIEVGADTVHTDPTDPNLGAGAEIAVLDSQVDGANPDLDGAGKVLFQGNFTQAVPSDPNDPAHTQDEGPCTPATCPHGTAVADVAAGENGDSGMAGVAPAAVIRSYNVFRRFTYDNPAFGQPGEPARLESVTASSADIADALASVAANIASLPNLVAVNMSLGGPFDNALIRDAIAALHSAAPKVTVVVAAGNDGGERADFPAGDPYVLSVGAIGQTPVYDGNGNRVACPATAPPSTDPWSVTSFSNRGDVDVVAPGRCVTAWYPPEDTSGAVSGPATVTKVDGTSFAAPMVAGIAALLASAATPVYGDAARAAIMAGAAHSGASVNTGLGAAKAPAAIALGGGPTTYTALDVERGGQVATSVGKRRVEVLRVDPTTTTAPAMPALSATYGTFSGITSTTAVIGTAGVRRGHALYAVPADNRSGQTFTMTAGTSGETSVVPMKMLDAADGFEGAPSASNEAAGVPLTWGSRSAFVRSAYVTNNSELDWSFVFDNHGWSNTADLFIWEPPAPGQAADAAAEPLGSEWPGSVDDPNANTHPGSDYVIPGYDECSSGGRLCNYGRWLVGWVTFGPGDSSSSVSRYQLTLTYAGPTSTLSTPALVSSVGTSSPFTVKWGGTRASKYDVYYGVKTKVGTTWALTAWTLWKNHTAGTGAVFGSGGSPVTVAQGQTYYFLVRSFDAYGNPSLYTSKATTVPLDDYNALVKPTASFTGGPAAGRWQGTLHASSSAGGQVVVTATTVRYTVVGDMCPTCGQFRVYVDGVYKGTYDSYSSTTKTRQALYTSGIYSGGPKSHKLQIVVVGTPGRPRVAVDGIGTLR